MQRYFYQGPSPSLRSLRMEGDDFHHMANVMRMKPGERIVLVFADGREGVYEISEINRGYAEVAFVQWIEKNRELPVRVTIASAMLKGDRWEWLIQKGTELGAGSFIPVVTERTVVKLEEKKIPQKIRRWEKIAKEAAEQSERNRIPAVEKPRSFHALVEMSRAFDHRLAAYEEEGRKGESENLLKLFRSVKPSDSLLVLTGPEGGFSKREIETLTEQNFFICGIGPRILRAETAPLYILSNISFYFELMMR
ncbi:MAG: 16S rRNA (uracil(1498)-N(3))-methyltransferase [Caldibacillus debilis]|uniref:Ribosomal RNA small subunit methyltransferase E n=1 Tax=Caldibacillus debilis TaxID=301148 RepID=A0A3E0JUT1_9BACI|nr:16S rRNA (uracil(1498)-N(3))-methyltransferase [Caldibacillus debilis]REJ23824.1 MAG: 16S rRNA (uracil(1498)-N(3))-methyltransferase [Caldibacillus debilis]REJ28206.1 MAG: 16S rRNA (uracil(1498)-N(3))-methyltransferase [Caldibacillus debilis]